MAAHINYQITHVRLIHKRNQESHQTNDPPLNENQVAATFPVNFMLYETDILIHSPMGIVFFPTAGMSRFISPEVTHIPVGDSLCRHVRDFKEKLTDMGIPEIKQLDILAEVTCVARGMSTDNGVSTVVFKILKTIYREVRVHDVEEDDVRRAERESMEVEAKPIPATKSSIDALVRVVFDGKGSARDCIVCMEEMEAGSEAIRMPCSHVYHSECIVQWLQTSHLCPLCRYHMPFEL